MPAPLRISSRLVIAASDLREQFTRASGPGGQHVNKTETAVQLWFDLRNTQSLTPQQRQRVEQALGHRLTDAGEVLISVDTSRSRERNRVTARERLAQLLVDALRPVKRRRPTRPTAASRRKRLSGKKAQAKKKSLRKKPPGSDAF